MKWYVWAKFCFPYPKYIACVYPKNCKWNGPTLFNAFVCRNIFSFSHSPLIQAHNVPLMTATLFWNYKHIPLFSNLGFYNCFCIYPFPSFIKLTLFKDAHFSNNGTLIFVRFVLCTISKFCIGVAGCITEYLLGKQQIRYRFLKSLN